jgi:hypothetical protein
MADASGQADIRGLDIDKAAKGFAEEQYIFKSSCTVAPTSAREVRWYSRTKGVLTGVTTTGITKNLIANVAERAQPSVVERTWTRNTSYVKKYFVESPTISMEDIKDTDIDILATNVRDLTMAVTQQVDAEIAAVISGATGINTQTMGAPWGTDVDTMIPIADIMSGAALIANDFYQSTGLDIYMNPNMHAALVNYLISTAGSSIPAFASDKVSSGVVMQFLSHNVKVTTVLKDQEIIMLTPQKTCTWKTFTPITATTIVDPGIGTKIRVWTEGTALATDPESSCLITGS